MTKISSRITIDDITIITVIYLYISKTCAFYKSLEQNKSQIATFGNIEYNSIEICTIVGVLH